jgi:hypothetical protein
MAEQAAVDGWGPGRTAVTKDPPLNLNRMMGFFITRRGGDKKMGMSPFAGPSWTSKAVGLIGEKQARLEGAFVSDSRTTAGPDRASGN